MAPKIFISYCREDKNTVLALKDDIERYTGENSCWIDVNGIESDQQFEDVIINAIEQTDIFLYMHSSNSDRSRWMRKEIDYAAFCGKRIVILQLDDSAFAKWFLFNYQKQQRTLITSPDEKRRLLEDLRSWTGYQPPTTHPEPPQPAPAPATKPNQSPSSASVNTMTILKALIVILAALGVYAGVRILYGHSHADVQSEQTVDFSSALIDDETITVKGVSFKMIHIEGGTFKMGSDNGDSDEKPVHEVTLSSYYIGETEVTQELWETVMGSNPSWFKDSQNPVADVSWNDCQEFISKLNSLTGKRFRLPTEAEWEFAARGGNKSQGYEYSGSNDIDEVAWYGYNSSSIHRVKTKSPNELGIYDMSGNVWEWCNDRYGVYPSTSVTNPTGASEASNRINRGGSWYNGNASYFRVSSRDKSVPTDQDFYLGLRLAL